jgi:hypothetical protein
VRTGGAGRDIVEWEIVVALVLLVLELLEWYLY